jgi:serine/threonine-protein kinase
METLSILNDIATTLTDLDRQGVVHRDLKPENVLILNGRWCLADFGISRFAEATTGLDTRKFAMSPPYAAPERWRSERVTSATDVYAFGVIAFEILSGERPFLGPSESDYREQHLHGDAQGIVTVGAAMAALVGECLYKAPEARPSPANLSARLTKIAQQPASAGLARLQEANHSVVLRQSEAARAASLALTEAQRRSELGKAAMQALSAVTFELRQSVAEAAPAAEIAEQGTGGWRISFDSAVLRFGPLKISDADALAAYGAPPPFDVLAYSSVDVLMQEPNRWGYLGRSHSLWYCDAQSPGHYLWFETAFMNSPFLSGANPPVDPYDLSPSAANEAVAPVITSTQVAWPFTQVVPGDIGDFISRWAEWFAQAAEGRLRHPESMPEIPPEGTYRR